MFGVKTGRKFIVVMYVVTGIFALQLFDKAIDPMLANGMFGLLMVYIGGQAFLDTKKSKQEQS